MRLVSVLISFGYGLFGFDHSVWLWFNKYNVIVHHIKKGAGNYPAIVRVITYSNKVSCIILRKFTSLLFNILTPKEQTRLFALTGFDLLMGMADVAFIIVMLLIVQVYTGSKPRASGVLYRSIFLSRNPVVVTGVFLILFCIKNIIGVWIAKSQHKFVFDVASRLSDKNIMDYLKGSYINFVNVDSSQQIRRISQIPIEFSTYILTNFQQIIAQCILIAFTITAILLYHPVLFVLLLLLLMPPVVLLGWYVKQQLKKVRTQIKTNSAKVIQYLQEALGGYIESNIYNRHHFLAGRYNQFQQQMNGNIATLQTLQGVSSRFFEVFALLGFFILVTLNKFYAGKTAIDLLTIGVFMAAAYKIIPGMVKILNSAGQIKTYSFILDDLSNSINNQEDIPASVFAVKPITSIRFAEVSFKFKNNIILNKVSFDIEPGDMIGISGASGGGKTTMINLLLGFLDQQSGQIFINDKLVNAAERKACWPQIAYVKQQNYFINDTILHNITLSDDSYHTDRLTWALSLSGLDGFLREYPEGINKTIYEHGKNISGGQRQRIALARALYHDFDLLILDEPFSEIDESAEQQILLGIKNLATNGKMILLITHNRVSLAYCNKILSPYALQT